MPGLGGADCYTRSALTSGGLSVGAWRRWLARSVRDAEVGGSSPLAPTIFDDDLRASRHGRPDLARGCAAVSDTRGPSSPARIKLRSRSKRWAPPWEWLHKGAEFTDDESGSGALAGDTFTPELFARLLDEEYGKLLRAATRQCIASYLMAFERDGSRITENLDVGS